MNNITQIQLRRYIDRTEIRENTLNIYQAKLSRNKNEELDQCEVNFKTKGRPNINEYDRVLLETNYFNWYVASVRVKDVSKKRDIYNVQLILVELTSKLNNYICSNLSFNNFLDEGDDKNFLDEGNDEGANIIYNNAYEVIARLIRLTPFELERNLDTTRIVSSFRDADNTLLPVMTARCETLLKEYTQIPEFQFQGRTLLEAINQVFNLVGGAVRLVANELGDTVIDINLFSENEQEQFVSYFSYEEEDNIDSYSNNAEVSTNNIIDSNTTTVLGHETSTHFESDEVFVSDDLAIIKTSTGIYRRKRVFLGIAGTTEEQEITDLVLTPEQRRLLQTGIGTLNDPSIRNTAEYSRGDNRVLNWGTTVKKGDEIFDETVYTAIAGSVELRQKSGINEYRVRMEYVPLFEYNRFNVKSKDFTRDNKKATININSGDRINDIDKITKYAKNSVSRLGAKTIFKKQKINNLNDIIPLGTKDTDTNFYITSYEVEILRNSIIVTYILSPFLGTLPSIVGVDSELRFTDIEVGAGLTRVEAYDDYLIFNTDGITFSDDSSLTNRGKRKAINLFSEDDNEYSHFLFASSEIPTPIFKEGNIFSSEGSVYFYLIFDNQTFAGNKIIDSGENPDDKFKETRKIERGVRYTRGNALLDKFALAYGYDIINTQPTKGELLTIPEAQLFVDTETEPIFEIGETTIIRDTINLPLEDSGSSAYAIGIGSSDSINQTDSIFINPSRNATQLKLTLNLIEDFTRPPLGNPSAANLQEFEISVVDTFNNAIPFYNSTTPVDNLQLTLDLGLIEIKEVQFFIKGTCSGGEEILEVDTGITTDLIGRAGYFAKNISIEYVESTGGTEEGLLIEKNINEIIGFNYGIQYHRLYDSNKEYDIVLGDALTTNSRFLFSKDASKKYTSFEVYVSNETINENDTTRIQGSLVTNTFSITTVGLDTPDEYYVASVLDQNLQVGGSYSIIGVRNDAVGEVPATRDFMYGVNARSKDVKPRTEVTIFATHFHPQEVINY